MTDVTVTTTETLTPPARRAPDGRFLGKREHPLLPRRKEEIIRLKENLEAAVRGPGGIVNVERTIQLLRKVWQLAMDGDMKAARIYLGIAMAPAGEESKNNAPPQIVIKVENATFSAVEKTATAHQPPIDGEFTETK